MMPCSGCSVMPKGEGVWEKPYMSSEVFEHVRYGIKG